MLVMLYKNIYLWTLFVFFGAEEGFDGSFMYRLQRMGLLVGGF